MSPPTPTPTPIHAGVGAPAVEAYEQSPCKGRRERWRWGAGAGVRRGEFAVGLWVGVNGGAVKVVRVGGQVRMGGAPGGGVGGGGVEGRRCRCHALSAPLLQGSGGR
eukprot:scaffold14071_cov105-Isochrysis_galbana.AAC.4